MIEYTSLYISRRLAKAGFKKENAGHGLIGYPCDAIYNGRYKWELDTSCVEWFSNAELPEAPAYRSGTLLSWLLSHGDGIEITPDIDGFNVTYWVKHEDYNGINIFLCNALGEVILAVMAKEAKHD